MTSKKAVEDFISSKEMAFAGVSRKKSKFSAAVYRDLKKKGFRLYPVNPNTDRIGDDACVPSVLQGQ